MRARNMPTNGDQEIHQAQKMVQPGQPLAGGAVTDAPVRDAIRRTGDR